MSWCDCHDSGKPKRRAEQAQASSNSSNNSTGGSSKPKAVTKPARSKVASASSGSGSSSSTTGVKGARQKALKTFISKESPTWVGIRVKKLFVDTATKKPAMFKGR